MNALGNKIPQEGTTRAAGGESLTSVAKTGVSPTDSGGGKNAFGQRRQISYGTGKKMSVLDEILQSPPQEKRTTKRTTGIPRVTIERKAFQLSGPTSATPPDETTDVDWTKVTDPFARRDSINRTPPMGMDVGTAMETDKEDRKRQAEESPEEKQRTKRQRGKNTLALVEAVLRISALLGEDAGDDLRKEVLKAENLARTVRAEEEEKVKLAEEEKKGPETKEMATQTTPEGTEEASTQTQVWHKPTEKKVIGDLKDVKSYKDFKDIASHKWREEVFTNVETKVGNPLRAEKDVVKCTIVEPGDLEMNRSIQKAYAERYPELRGLPGTFEVIEQVTRKKGATEGQVVEKVIKMTHDGKEESVWARLCSLRNETVDDAAVAFHHLEDLPLERTRKMVQAIFQGGQTKVAIYTTEKKSAGQRKMSTIPAAKTRDTYALTVDCGQRQYCDVLKDVRQAVMDKPGNEKIQAIRSTRENQLLIVLKKDDKTRDRLRKDMEEKKLRVRAIGGQTKMETVHIRGLDAVTTKDEVSQSLKAAVGEDKTTRIGNLRPYAREMQAVTVTMAKAAAATLIRGRFIRIGPVECTVSRRLAPTQCPRCWSYDHGKKERCTGPDRQKACKKCGLEGHRMADCPNDGKCLVCNEEGHILGTGKCPAFRKALAKARQDEEKRARTSRMKSNIFSTTEEEDTDDVFQTTGTQRTGHPTKPSSSLSP